ncbi:MULTISPECIES: hypothetical protein [Nostoc]|uniref:Phytanoyl-CoA dioxygenase n=2 Tax=Nostoc TaxID=1177 RepID=A0ABR8I7I9_9NOSO|nr:MULTISPECIES: hypothetical protein [Nostoc]MBD2561470.1 hypothetical protein [Nostoc linckia FACHB-391]MBD2646608.1 hypothetical protein [Nostoc foliaceum FACHB-393]
MNDNNGQLSILTRNYFKKKFPLLYDICYENYKGLVRNPQWLLMRKLARFRIGRFLREFFLKATAKSSNFYVSESPTLFPYIDVNLVVESLKKDGFYLGINLPQNIVEEIVSFAHSNPCYIHRQCRLGFYYSQKELAEIAYGEPLTLAGYFNTALLCPAILQLQNDPKLLAIAAKFLEHEPAHQCNQLWWSFSGEVTDEQRRQTFQMFHYDMDDYRFLKFFFYLTDVDANSGAHICIRGSHKQKKLSHLLLPKSETDAEIINYYTKGSLVTICGNAGFGFVEDTFCFHKSKTPINRDRLILQLEYAITDYGMQHDTRDISSLRFLVNPKL